MLELLHRQQAQAGALGEEAVAAAAASAGLPVAEMYAAISAYPLFRLAQGRSGEPHPRRAGLLAADPALAVEGPRVDAPAGSFFFGDDDPAEALRAAWRMRPEELIAAVERSGLRGAGGAGFPAARKWAAVRAAAGETRYVVCNADESEPGTFKDRALLERQPRRVLCGVAIAAHAAGAAEAVVYLRAGYEKAFPALQAQIAALDREGLLGGGLEVHVRRGAGLYVCGEETALLNSLEGRRPEPRNRPPYPVTHGLFGRPTLVSNVETLAAAVAVVSRGPEAFAAARPKLYSVSGDVPRPGVLERPMEVTAAHLVRAAGGDPGEVSFFSLGGVSGGLLPPSALDVRMDFDAPRAIGAQLGSGSLIAGGRGRCPVAFAGEAMRFFASESCGRCFPCRIGTQRMRERLEALAHAGAGAAAGAAELSEIAALTVAGSACGLGVAAGSMARDLVSRFPEAVREHAAGTCRARECGRS